MYKRLASINLRRLQVATAVAEANSVTEAANRLNMTPPAVTKSLKELEMGLSAELFDRTSSGMFPTPAGEIFLRHAARALHEIERGRKEVSLLIGGEGGKVVIGSTSDAAFPSLTIAMGRLIDRRPGIDLKLVGGTFDTLLRDSRAGALDFFLGVAPKDATKFNLDVEKLYDDELRIVVRPDHALLAKDVVQLEDLLDYRWVLNSREGPLMRELHRRFDERDIPFPDEPIIVEPISLVRGLLQNSNLVSAMTKSRVSEEVALGQLKTVPVDLHTRQTISIIRRAEPYQSTWAKELVTLLKRATAELISD